MGRLKSVAINEHASHCFKSEKEKMPCCEDVEEELKVDEVTTASFDLDLQPDLYQIAIITFTLLNEDFSQEDLAGNSLIKGSPPLPYKDKQVLHQTFLI
ncbi:MAG: hypothetical protein AB8B73_06485 [Ekhidna sp.]